MTNRTVTCDECGTTVLQRDAVYLVMGEEGNETYLCPSCAEYEEQSEVGEKSTEMGQEISLQEFIQRFSESQQSAAANFYVHDEFDTGEQVASTGEAKSLLEALNESDEDGRGGNACTQIRVGKKSYIIDVERYTMPEEGVTCGVSVYTISEERKTACYLSQDTMLQDFIEALRTTSGISVEQDWSGDTFSESSSYYS